VSLNPFAPVFIHLLNTSDSSLSSGENRFHNSIISFNSSPKDFLFLRAVLLILSQFDPRSITLPTNYAEKIKNLTFEDSDVFSLEGWRLLVKLAGQNFSFF
jgi:hypothetical protein